MSEVVRRMESLRLNSSLAEILESTHFLCSICHCTHCRRYTGGHGSLNLGLESGKLTYIKKDSLTRYEDTSDRGQGPFRWFCNRCGSPIGTTLEYAPEALFIKAGSIDNFEALPAVGLHLFIGEISPSFKKGWNFDGQKCLVGMPGSQEAK